MKLLRVFEELSQQRQCLCSRRNSCGGKVVSWGPAGVGAMRWDSFPHCLLAVIYETFPNSCLCVWSHTHTLNIYF